MKIEQQEHGSVCVIVPHGPLTRDDLADFQSALAARLREKQGRVVLDFTDVPFVDSAGIELIYDTAEDAAHLNRARFAQLGDACREALDLTNVLSKMEVFDTVESAIRSFKR